jgi:ATP-dependent Lhr-like helicase
VLYATDNWALLQSVACWELYKEGFIEPTVMRCKPFDILFHQVLSVLKEKSGFNSARLNEWVKRNPAFENILTEEVESLIDDMIERDYIEDLKQELIVGLAGEMLTNNKSFYSVFESEEEFKVINAGKCLGEIPYSLQIVPDENILLAARVWKIVDVDRKAKRIEVVPAKDGRKPIFFGAGGDIHPRIRQKMLELLYSSDSYDEAHESATDAINELRLMFNGIGGNDFRFERPVLENENVIQFYSFSGTKINRTINFLLKASGFKIFYDEETSSFELDKKNENVMTFIDKMKVQLLALDSLVEKELVKNPYRFKFSKWGNFLPLNLKKQYILENYFDPIGLRDFLKNVKLKRHS